MLRTPFFLAAPLMLAGVAFAQKVQTDYDKSLDFSKFHTYAWREHPILRNNPQIAETFSVALNLVRSEINGEFHERQGLDMSKVPRMSPEDVVTASLKALET